MAVERFDVAPGASFNDTLTSQLLGEMFSGTGKSTEPERKLAVEELEVMSVLESDGPMTFTEFTDNRKDVRAGSTDSDYRRAFRTLFEEGKIIKVEDDG